MIDPPRKVFEQNGRWDVPVGHTPHRLLAVVIIYQAYYDSVTWYARSSPLSSDDLVADTHFYEGWELGKDELLAFWESEWCEWLMDMCSLWDVRRDALSRLDKDRETE